MRPRPYPELIRAFGRIGVLSFGGPATLPAPDPATRNPAALALAALAALPLTGLYRGIGLTLAVLAGASVLRSLL